MDSPPYRVYRGGRRPRASDEPELGGLPTGDAAPEPEHRGPVVLPADAPPPQAPPLAPARRRFGVRRPLRLALLVAGGLSLILLVWLVIGYVAFRDAVERSNARLDRPRFRSARPALVAQHGLLTSGTSNILMLGADKTGHSDSIQLIHVDPGHGLYSTLAIPRDLRVAIAGFGTDKINAAYFHGGPGLAIRTVRAFTGIPINHVVLVDFTAFSKLIDDVGGVDVVSSERIVSNKFEGRVWRFPRGPVHLGGRAALAYSRIRENQLNPRDSDITRGQRQQQVMSALENRLASFGSLLELRTLGSSVVGPLTTDLSANQLLSLGWDKLRAQRTLTCHLGGTPLEAGGVSYLQSSADNVNVVRQALGESAVIPPVAGDAFAPGCRQLP